MKPKNHQEKQKELEQAFKQNQINVGAINSNQDRIMSQYELVEMSGTLFDLNEKDQKILTNTTPLSADPQPVQSTQMPLELQQAQQAVQQAQQQLLNENQQLQQALYELHQAQERVKQCQNQVQQAQQQLQTTEVTVNSIVDNLK